MLKKYLKGAVSLVLALVLTFTTCTGALAASSKKTYIKDVVISYGNTADEAKKWLADNGYEILDYDLNEGADDWRSTKRAVYIGYTTTEDPEEAITDMRLMNMKGGYSVQDYQMLLDEQKENIRVFIDDFIAAINEYRDNYNAGQERAKAAYEVLNLLYDDDSEQLMGDALLKKIKEEYTDEEWSALSADEQAKTADMTTILMQGNSNAVLTIEQVIAMAADSGDKLWTERYDGGKTYDDMLDKLMEEKNLSVSQAEKQLAAEYDEDARAIASKLTSYISFLENYMGADVTLSSTEKEVEAYKTAHEDFDYMSWFAAGTQYELLGQLENDGVTLLELITGDDFDILNADRYLLYPLIASLSDGQRACLDFLSMYYLVALGINGDDVMQQAMKEIDLGGLVGEKNSVYDGVDREIYGGNVALTNEALRLQASSGKNAIDTSLDHISTTTFVMYGVFGLSVIGMVAAWGSSVHLNNLAKPMQIEYDELFKKVGTAIEEEVGAATSETIKDSTNARISIEHKMSEVGNSLGSVQAWSKFFQYAGIAMTCVTAVLLVYSIWRTWQETNEYYNAEFTPIPGFIVDESVNDSDEKDYTYYTAAKCNRADAGMVSDAAKLLGDYGDINGDVGRQWVALYTTHDKAAGDPIVTTGLKVQYESSTIPKDSTNVLSMFGENAARNLTNEQLGYTYADDKDGIYMFYNVDENAFAGSVFSNSSYILISVAAAAVVGAAAFLTGMRVQRKKLQGKAGESV